MTISTAYGLFGTALNTFATAQGLSVAWENISFMPPAGTYLRATLLPATPRAAGLGTSAQDYMRGILQVDVMGATEAGWGVTWDIADDLRAHFGRGDILSGTGTTVHIESVAVGPAITEDSRYRLPVSITFYSLMNPV